MMGQTDRWTPDRCIDPAPHSMWAVAVTSIIDIGCSITVILVGGFSREVFLYVLSNLVWEIV